MARIRGPALADRRLPASPPTSLNLHHSPTHEFHNATGHHRIPLHPGLTPLHNSQRSRPPHLLPNPTLHNKHGEHTSKLQTTPQSHPPQQRIETDTLLRKKQFQLRYCPALQKKPTPSKTTEPAPKPPNPDPFKDPAPDLLIATFPPWKPSHTLVLNKFPVIPNHFILATRDWESQTDLLEPGDLEATYECLKAWDDSEQACNGNGDGTLNGSREGGGGNGKGNGKRLFAFFNSGEESGASQPHRHLQFLPIEAMRAGSDGWEPLIDLVSKQSSPHEPFQYIPNLPIKHFALPIPTNPTPESLHEIYLTLYHAAVSSTKQESPSTSTKSAHTSEGETATARSGPASISYNLAMTLKTMLLCPRKSETACVPVDVETLGGIVDGGVVSVNGTILAGTLMVKAEAEWDVLRREPGVLGRVLGDVGILNEG